MKQLANPDDLGPRCREVLDYVFEHPKASVKEIAKAMGLSEARVYKIKAHPKFVACFPSKARSKAKTLIPQAMGKLEELMSQSENLEVSRKVVADVLASQKVLENSPTTQINVFQTMSFDDLKRKVDESRAMPDGVIEGSLVDPQP